MNPDHHLHRSYGTVAVSGPASVVRLRSRQDAAEVALAATATAAADTPVPKVAAPAGSQADGPASADRTNEPVSRTFCHKTPKGLIRYLLQRLPGVLYVERQQSRRLSTQTIQSVCFSNTRSFEAWCDADPMRFDEPRLVAQVKREGTELLQRHD